MRVALVLPKHRLAPWHQRLAATLRQRHGVAIFIDEARLPIRCRSAPGCASSGSSRASARRLRRISIRRASSPGTRSMRTYSTLSSTSPKARSSAPCDRDPLRWFGRQHDAGRSAARRADAAPIGVPQRRASRARRLQAGNREQMARHAGTAAIVRSLYRADRAGAAGRRHGAAVDAPRASPRLHGDCRPMSAALPSQPQPRS